jgi:hypothetical protein
MMVSILVNIESIKTVKGIGVFEMSRKISITINTYQMRTAQNGINMNDVHDPLPTLANIGLHHPHPDIGARIITHCGKPSHKRAWIQNSHVLERHEEEDMGSKQSPEAWEVGVTLDEDTVVLRGTTTP